MSSITRERRATSDSSKGNAEYPSRRARVRKDNAKAKPQLLKEHNSGHLEKYRTLLAKYLAEMKKDHAFIAKSVLTAARLEVDRRPQFKGKGQGGQPKIIYDEVSPFKDMKSIHLDISLAAAGARKDIARFNVLTPKYHTYTNRMVFLETVLSKVAPGIPIPRKCRNYTTLRNNIVAENEEEIRYIPYFGEENADDDLNLEEFYVVKAGREEEYKNQESAAMYSVFIHDFLKEAGVSLDAVTQYLIGDISAMSGDGTGNQSRRRNALPEDFNLANPKVADALQNLPTVQTHDLQTAADVCEVFKEVTDISLWEVVKKTNMTVKDSMSSSKHTTAGMNATVLENSDEDVQSQGRQIAALTGVSKNRGMLDDDSQDESEVSSPQEGYRQSIAIPGWTCSGPGAIKNPFQEDEACSEFCFIKKDISSRIHMSIWSDAQIALLKSSVGVLQNNPRCACLCAAVINKLCTEIHLFLTLLNLLPIEDVDRIPQNSTANDLHPDAVKVLKRKKTNAGYLPGYPADCDKTHTHDKRKDVRPCHHLGPCTSSCECVRNHVTCEKACACPIDCPRRWRGCTCRRDGKACSTERCICQKANRECDPDLCGTCGAVDVLEPSNRYDEAIAKSRCQNVWLQRGEAKKTMMGHSSVSGIGLFVAEALKKGEFIGEYKGEMISDAEAERRGKIYDRRGISFLFTINGAYQAIDASRMGNKFRFINNSKERPNCTARIVLANCIHRIGFWASRDIMAGEELFFDYGYSQKTVRFVQKEPPPIPGLLDAQGVRRTKKQSATSVPRGTRAVKSAPTRRKQMVKKQAHSDEHGRESSAELQQTESELVPFESDDDDEYQRTTTAAEDSEDEEEDEEESDSPPVKRTRMLNASGEKRWSSGVKMTKRNW